MGVDARSPSLSWARRYSRNLEGFMVKNSQPIEASRVVNSSKEHVSSWFKSAEALLNPSTCRPEFMFNMDETMVDASKRSTKVIVPRESLPLKLDCRENEGFHITLVLCVAADGTAMKPSIILPLKQFPLELEEIVGKFYWAGQSNGWINGAIFKSWVIDAFIPYVNRRRMELNSPNERAILFVDSHESRRCPDALEALMDANVSLYTFPSHTSHFLQPLDCGINRAFKTKLRSLKSEGPTNTLPQRRLQLLKKCARACHEALYDETIKKAWAISGLYPWDAEQVLTSPYVVDELPPELTNVGKKRKRSNISISGSLLTEEIFINQLRDQALAQQKPKRPRGRPPKRKHPEMSDEDNSE